MLRGKIQANQVGRGHSLRQGIPYDDIKGDLTVSVSPPHDTDGSIIINAGTRHDWVDIELSPEGAKALIERLRHVLNWPLT